MLAGLREGREEEEGEGCLLNSAHHTYGHISLTVDR